MDKHAQQSAVPSQRTSTKEEYEDHDSSVSSTTADVEKEIIAVNALNEGATQPFDDPNVAEAQAQQRPPHGVQHGEEVDGVGSQQFADGGEVEKQVTRRSIRSGKAVSVNNVAAIPNGGTKAWLQVLGAFFLFFNSWGISKLEAFNFGEMTVY